MTRAVLAVAALLAAGCVPPRGGSWEFDWRGFPPVDRADRAVQVILDNAPCRPPGGWYGGRISFWPDPFECGWPPILVHGCMPAGPYLPTFAVGYRVPLSDSALADEVGHYVFMSCGRGLGETDAHVYTPEFVAWLGGVRAAMRAEGL